MFVTGAASFLGNAVVAELVGRGHSVMGLVSNHETGKTLKEAGANYVVGDLKASDAWCEEIKEADKVISLDTPFASNEPIPKEVTPALLDAYGRQYMEEVTNLIKAAADGKAKGVIINYSSLCMGDRKGKWVNDTDSLDPVGYCRPVTGYFKSITKTAEDAGIPLIELYTSHVYGNGGCFAQLIEGFKDGTARIIGNGDNYMSVIHVEDAAAYIALAAEKLDRNENICLSDNRPVTQKVFMDHIAGLMDLPSPQSVDFETFARDNGMLIAETMASSTRVPGLKAIELLGYVPKHRSFEEGVAYTLNTMGVLLEFKKAA
jgi:nucleoside-diphosphate-sugar epimerase